MKQPTPSRRESQTAERHLARLQSLTAALAGVIATDDVAAVILSTGLEAVGAHAGLVGRAVENGRKLEVLVERTEMNWAKSAVKRLGVSASMVDGRLRLSTDAHTPLCDGVRSRNAVWLQSPAEIRALYPEHAAYLEEVAYRAIGILPLVSRNELIGGLLLAFSEARTFDAEERAFLTVFADQCALAQDRAQLYEDAVAARDAAERATMMRDEFLSIVAHDLGSPLNAIGLWAEFLSKHLPTGAEGEQIKKGTSKIQNSVRQMTLLLHDLGDVASIDTGRLSIEKGEENVQAIVADIVEVYEPLCVEKGLTITGRASALRIPCDRHRVEEVLGNLVANALKFTPSGGRITVEAVPSGGDVRFSVADTGPGIPEEARAHVFERYWRGRERDLTKGVGLGLFIAKGIIDSHGGKIWVESTVGGGSTFCFTLPVAPASQTP